MMKHTAFVPIKTRSTRVPKKNFRNINGKKLYVYILDTLQETNFDEIYVDTDSDEISNLAKNYGFKVIQRLPKLAEDNSNGNELLEYHSGLIQSDVYYQTFATAPLLKASTINDCINAMENEDYDSCFTAVKHYEWTWFDGKPINYHPATLPRSQDAKPVIFETTGLYGIKASFLKRNIQRIGNKPYMKFVEKEEAIDLDTEFDFKILEQIVKEK